MRHYYATRASEYDAIYQKPERQADLRQLRAVLPTLLRGRAVLEIACGTGYWTQWLAPGCDQVVAQDINTEVLEIAAQRLASVDNALLICDDAFSLASLPRGFSGAFAGFWYSHLRRDQVADFLSVLHSRLLPRARVLMLDNRYVEGSSTPLSRSDDDGNTWQLRTVAATGRTFEVLKNFPTAESFAAALPANVHGLQFVETQYYWYASYELD